MPDPLAARGRRDAGFVPRLRQGSAARLVARGEAVFAYRFREYWQDVGELDSYYESNMSLLSDHPPLDLSDPTWLVHTQSADRLRCGSRAVGWPSAV
jgi:hypothetical protein